MKTNNNLKRILTSGTLLLGSLALFAGCGNNSYHPTSLPLIPIIPPSKTPYSPIINYDPSIGQVENNIQTAVSDWMVSNIKDSSRSITFSPVTVDPNATLKDFDVSNVSDQGHSYTLNFKVDGSAKGNTVAASAQAKGDGISVEDEAITLSSSTIKLQVKNGVASSIPQNAITQSKTYTDFKWSDSKTLKKVINSELDQNKLDLSILHNTSFDKPTNSFFGPASEDFYKALVQRNGDQSDIYVSSIANIQNNVHNGSGTISALVVFHVNGTEKASQIKTSYGLTKLHSRVNALNLTFNVNNGVFKPVATSASFDDFGKEMTNYYNDQVSNAILCQTQALPDHTSQLTFRTKGDDDYHMANFLSGLATALNPLFDKSANNIADHAFWFFNPSAPIQPWTRIVPEFIQMMLDVGNDFKIQITSVDGKEVPIFTGQMTWGLTAPDVSDIFHNAGNVFVVHGNEFNYQPTIDSPYLNFIASYNLKTGYSMSINVSDLFGPSTS